MPIPRGAGSKRPASEASCVSGGEFPDAAHWVGAINTRRQGKLYAATRKGMTSVRGEIMELERIFRVRLWQG